jgi:hypothetical protein
MNLSFKLDFWPILLLLFFIDYLHSLHLIVCFKLKVNYVFFAKRKKIDYNFTNNNKRGHKWI